MTRTVHMVWFGCLLLAFQFQGIAAAQALPMEMPIIATDNGVWALIEPITGAPAPRSDLAISKTEQTRVVTAPLDANALAPARKRLIGRRLHVITGGGCVERARIDALATLVHVPISTAMATDDSDATSQAVALWSDATEHFIAAQLQVVAGSCEDPPSMALRRAIAPERVARRVDDKPFREAAVEATRQLPGYQEIQQRLEAIAPHARWEYRPFTLVHAFRMPAGRRTWVVVTMPNPPCTELRDSLWAAFSMSEGRPPRLIMSSNDSPMMVNVVFDRDGDGRPEYFVGFPYGERNAFRSSTGATLSTWNHYTVDAIVRTSVCHID